MALVLHYNDTFFLCHSFNNTHIIMAAKFIHYGGQIIYAIYFKNILWCNNIKSLPPKSDQMNIPNYERRKKIPLNVYLCLADQLAIERCHVL